VDLGVVSSIKIFLEVSTKFINRRWQSIVHMGLFCRSEFLSSLSESNFTIGGCKILLVHVLIQFGTSDTVRVAKALKNASAENVL